MRGLLKVQNKLFLSFALVVFGLVAAAVGYVGTIVSRQAGETIAEDMQHSLKVFEALQREKTQNLAALLRNISESPRLKAALDLKETKKKGKKIQVHDVATVADLAGELKQGLDLFQVSDEKGRLLSAAMGEKLADLKAPEPAAPPFDDFFAKAVDPENPLVSAGAMTWDSRLFITMTGPVPSGDRVVGGLRAGFEVGNKQAMDLREQTGSEVAFIVNPAKIVACSLAPAAASELERWLGTMKLDAMSTHTFEATVGAVPFLVQAAPLNDPAGRNLGWQIQLRSRSRVLALLSKVRGGVITIGATGLVIAVLLAYLIARGITAPLKDLVDGTRMVDRGNMDVSIPVRTRDELGVLAEAFNEMVKDLKEKERVKAVFGRYLPKAVADRVMADKAGLELGGEEREVAILFSDIRGFTAISEHIAPQNLVTMLNVYFTRMVDILLEHEGTLDKYVGDAIMAVFGAPVADHDAATKAVLTALEMQAALRALHAEFAAKGWPQFEIGIGINAGPVVAGNLGSIKQLSYTVIGEEVNLASRLCSKATKGQILISEAVFRKVKWSFECNRLEPITVKNVSHPVQVYEVTAVKAAGAAPAGNGAP